MALKHTGVELELLTDEAPFLLLENSIRGGIATISTRKSVANNPLLPGFNPEKPTTWITYLDANNLYKTAQSEPLPIGYFRFLTDHEIADWHQYLKIHRPATFSKLTWNIQNIYMTVTRTIRWRRSI